MKKIIPHIFVLICLLVLLFLGTWQVQRLQYKEALIAKIDSRVTQKPLIIQEYRNIEEHEFRKIILQGEYINEDEMLLLNKGFNGKQGQHVLTPFKISGGKTIIVDRGWIPPDKDPVHIDGEVIITGIIRAPQKLNSVGKLVVMENDPEKKVWFWFELPAMEKAVGIPPSDYYVDLTRTGVKTRNTTYPIPLPEKIEIYNEHLQYAITWYSLAFVLLVVYYFRFFRK